MKGTKMGRRDALCLVVAGTAALVGARVGSGWPAGEEIAASILTRKIPSSGEKLPVIGLGTWQTFDVEPTSAERKPLEEVVQAFANLGGEVVDTSPMYGRSEAMLGEIVASLNLRDRLFLATKVWTSGRLAGIRQMEESMRRLQANRIDLMQVHNLVDASTQLETLQEWKREGRIRYIGVTHYTAGGHEAVAQMVVSHPLDFIQINYSVGEREAERRLLPLAVDRGVAVIGNRPFAGGDLFRRLRARPLPDWAAEIDCDSWAQVLLKFVISNPAITCAIPATSKVAHLRENMKAGHGKLPDLKLRDRIIAEAV
jgi:aryl-alcohol dehydrogenase-like predicted oxidoreductase